MEIGGGPGRSLQGRTSPSSSGSGALDRLPQGGEFVDDRRRRHIVRSGGKSGVQIITAFKSKAAEPRGMSQTGKRPRDDVAGQRMHIKAIPDFLSFHCIV